MLVMVMLWAFSAPLLAQGAPPNITLETAFIEMAFNGNLAAVQEFVSKGTPADSTIDDNSTALMWASFNGHTPVAAYLLEQGATVDIKDANGRTALLYASSGPYPDTVGLLLRNGADVNVQGKAEGFTALMMAASEGHLNVARVLLLNGAAVDTLDKDGDTARKFAKDNGNTEMLKLLDDLLPSRGFAYDTVIPFVISQGLPTTGAFAMMDIPFGDGVPHRALADNPEAMERLLTNPQLPTMLEIRTGILRHAQQEYDTVLEEIDGILMDIEGSISIP